MYQEQSLFPWSLLVSLVLLPTTFTSSQDTQKSLTKAAFLCFLVTPALGNMPGLE